MSALLTNIASFAFISRLCVIIVQIFANHLIPDHDAGVFYPPDPHENKTALDLITNFVLGGLRRWDAVYFTHIAEHGYTYENCIAFFPLYPMAMSVISRILSILGILQLQYSLLLCGVILNCALFSWTACNLYLLGIETGIKKHVSLLSVIVFCLNPASIFMTAPYSESLYIFLLILALLHLKRAQMMSSSLFIALSVLVRSNGLLGFGFILHNWLQSFISKLFSVKEETHLAFAKRTVKLMTSSVIKITSYLIICFCPFLLYQYYIYRLFCVPYSQHIPAYLIAYGQSQGYKMQSDSPPPWCFHTLPISYSYIQANHWGVGFLKYYQLKQFPNFLLAAPVIFLSLKTCIYFFMMDPKRFYTLGLITSKNFDKVSHEGNSQGDKESPRKECLQIEYLVVYVFHLMFLTVFGCCFVHIQVVTRLLFSSSPLLYWFCGVALSKNAALVSFVQHLFRPLKTPSEDMSFFDSDTDASQCRRWNDGNSSSQSKKKDHRLSTSISFSKRSRSSVNPLCRRSLNPASDEGPWQYGASLSSLSSSGRFIKIIIFIFRNWGVLNVESQAILLYCVVYLVIGTVLFSNFMPWT